MYLLSAIGAWTMYYRNEDKHGAARGEVKTQPEVDRVARMAQRCKEKREQKLKEHRPAEPVPFEAPKEENEDFSEGEEEDFPFLEASAWRTDGNWRVRKCGCKYERVKDAPLVPCKKHKDEDKESEEDEDTSPHKSADELKRAFYAHVAAQYPPRLLVQKKENEAKKRALEVFNAHKCLCGEEDTKDLCVYHNINRARCFSCGEDGWMGECICAGQGLTYEDAIAKGYIPRVKQECVGCPDKVPVGANVNALCEACITRLRGSDKLRVVA